MFYRLHPTHPQEDLDVLGAGGSCGTTGDVLGDNTKGILEAAVPITVVLEEQKAVRGQGRVVSTWGCGWPRVRLSLRHTCSSVYPQFPLKL